MKVCDNLTVLEIKEVLQECKFSLLEMNYKLLCLFFKNSQWSSA